jgi:hypothetical protein
MTVLQEKHVDHIFVHYENLTSTTASRGTQRSALDRMLRFLNWPELSDVQLDCALRAQTTDAFKRERSSDVVTASDAYTPHLVCRIWAVIQPWAAPLGYQPFHGMHCD